LLTNLIRAGGDTLEQVRRALLGADASGEKQDETASAAEDSSPLQRVDDLFQDVLKTLNVPTSRDLQQLQAQLDELNARIAAMLAEEQQEPALPPQTPTGDSK
jgi:polyhydroxyalkanoate synthesis regulator phasin